MRKYTITMTEEQLALAVACIEDIHRFLAGQTELYNATTILDNSSEVQGMLKQMHPLVTPGLPTNASYGWDGMHCPNESQRKMIAATYYLYREMRHKYNLANKKQDVYTSETLRCKNSGEPIITTWED